METDHRQDAYADYLGVEVDTLGEGHATAALTVNHHHLNPHATAHGALLYSIVGAALAAAANDGINTGVVSGVHIDYLSPAYRGDRLIATATVAEHLARENLYTVRLVRVADGQIVARASGRATRRTRTEATP
ncbi:hotdog fold thioesterase [Rhodococcus sp. WS4]|nr:hotdog fold thioesterase [Rhodococcus sp. WS4]